MTIEQFEEWSLLIGVGVVSLRATERRGERLERGASAHAEDEFLAIRGVARDAQLREAAGAGRPPIPDRARVAGVATETDIRGICLSR